MKSIVFIYCTVISFSSFSQSITIKKGDQTILIKADVSEACNPEMVFMLVDTMPNYRGSFDKLEQDINELIKVDPKLKGEINIWATINCQGKAFGFQTIKFLDEDLEERLKKELIKLQNWEPGKHRNINIDTEINIKFSIKKRQNNYTQLEKLPLTWVLR